MDNKDFKSPDHIKQEAFESGLEHGRKLEKAEILAWCEENFLMDGMDHLFMKKYILLDNFQEYLKEKK